MRVLMTVTLDTDKTNQAIRDDVLPKTIKAAMEALRPEAAYFVTKNGRRTGFFVFDLVDVTDLPSAAEPFFQGMDAEIEVTPVMTFEDVQAGLQKLGAR